MGSDADRATGLKVILGLGNPGERYRNTRHNVGFHVVGELARRRGLTLASGDCRCRSAVAPGLILAMPQTFMNRSGFAARCLRERHDLGPEDFLIVYDEVHLPLGSLRLRTKGSPAGHRGMESVLENLGTADVARLRLGVGEDSGAPTAQQLSDFVLADFTAEQAEAVQRMTARAADACESWAGAGAEAAMQRFNGPAGDEVQ